MINIFRKIRQQLLTKNKFSKYLLYAIGEILLVVVGILIALQLNNWNEDRKSKILEIEIYKEIKDDITVSLVDLENGRSSHMREIGSNTKLRDHIMNELPFRADIARDLDFADSDDQFFPKTSGFEALKSIGLKTLSNDTLRQSITNLYQLGFVRIVGMGRDRAPVRNFQFLTPYQKYLKLSDKESFYSNYTENDSVQIFRKQIINYDMLMKDEQLVMKLQEAISLRRFKLRNYDGAIRWSNRILLEIDEELKRLEN